MSKSSIDFRITVWFKEGYYNDNPLYWSMTLDQLLKIKEVRKEAQEAIEYYHSLS